MMRQAVTIGYITEVCDYRLGLPRMDEFMAEYAHLQHRHPIKVTIEWEEDDHTDEVNQ